MDIEEKVFLLGAAALAAFNIRDYLISEKRENERAKREKDDHLAKAAAQKAELHEAESKRKADTEEKARQSVQREQELLKQNALRAENEAQLQSQKSRQLQNKAEDGIANFETQWANRLSGLVLIDTNVWMEPKFEPFCKELQNLLPTYGHKLKLPKVVIKEMENLKKEGDPVKRKKAVAGLSHIEQLQKLFAIDHVDTGQTTYADDSLIWLIQNQSLGIRKITLITDDAQLRRRALCEGREYFAGELSVLKGAEVVTEIEVRDRDKRVLKQLINSA